MRYHNQGFVSVPWALSFLCCLWLGALCPTSAACDKLAALPCICMTMSGAWLRSSSEESEPSEVSLPSGTAKHPIVPGTKEADPFKSTLHVWFETASLVTTELYQKHKTALFLLDCCIFAT